MRERESLRVFGQCILLYLQLYLIYYRSDVDVGKLPNHLKLCVLSILALFYHPTVSNGLRFIVL
jgi:hypothetical protein